MNVGDGARNTMITLSVSTPTYYHEIFLARDFRHNLHKDGFIGFQPENDFIILLDFNHRDPITGHVFELS